MDPEVAEMKWVSVAGLTLAKLPRKSAQDCRQIFICTSRFQAIAGNHHVITSPRHHIVTSPHHHITTSPHHHITTSPHHHTTTPPHSLVTISPSCHHPYIVPPAHMTWYRGSTRRQNRFIEIKPTQQWKMLARCFSFRTRTCRKNRFCLPFR